MNHMAPGLITPRHAAKRVANSYITTTKSSVKSGVRDAKRHTYCPKHPMYKSAGKWRITIKVQPGPNAGIGEYRKSEKRQCNTTTEGKDSQFNEDEYGNLVVKTSDNIERVMAHNHTLSTMTCWIIVVRMIPAMPFSPRGSALFTYTAAQITKAI
jgi:hypothetical protein